MTNAVELRTLADYLKLNYPIVLHADRRLCCRNQRFTWLSDSMRIDRRNTKNINEARELWLETVFELGGSIPLPSDRRVNRKIDCAHHLSSSVWFSIKLTILFHRGFANAQIARMTGVGSIFAAR
jgi:hypothetical protein